MMMLMLVLKKSVNFGKRGKNKTQIRKSIQKQIETLGKLFVRQNVKQRDKDLQMLVRKTIRNVKYCNKDGQN